MNELHIYPTSRALRDVSKRYKQSSGFLPSMMRMDEFEKRSILLDNKSLVDPLERTLLLREAAKFERFEILNLRLDLVRFFTRSDALFKFFEELSAEKVDFDLLSQADAYVEFETHLEILEQLLENYREILKARGLTDKAFIPAAYTLNEGFIANYEKIEIYLEGYLSRFELELLEKISHHTTLIIHYHTSKFNVKMQERFAAYGVNVPKGAAVSIDLSAKQLLAVDSAPLPINAEVYKVKERTEQVALAFEKIEGLIEEGIAPEKIALILPDEAFKVFFDLHDKHHNLNFAMGYDYTQEQNYKSLQAIHAYLKQYDKESIALLAHYGIGIERLHTLASQHPCGVEAFMEELASLGLLDVPLPKDIDTATQKVDQRIYEKLLHFLHIFKDRQLKSKEWLFLWLKALEDVTIDDVRGGKITVMGVLETRGVSFEGVVIVDFNDGIVPASSSKDQFLNSSVRAFAGLPTKNDREALQKQYYKRLLEQAKKSIIIYSSSENRLPSKFLYELGLQEAIEAEAALELLYSEPSQIKEAHDIVVEHFDAMSVTWSSSKLKTFLECKRKYYYRYIQKIKKKEEEEPNEGAFLHLLLEHLFKEQSSFTSQKEMEEKLYRLMDKLLEKEDAKTNYQKLLWKEKLQGFVQKQLAHFKAGWQVVEREKEFEGEIGGLRFKGRIDRIDQNQTHTLVLDYKSGKIDKEPKALNPEKITDFQMSIYYQLLQKRYQHIALAFVKILEGGEMQEVSHLEERNALLFEHIVTLKQTTSFVAAKCDTLATCAYCEFALMCERGEYL